MTRVSNHKQDLHLNEAVNIPLWLKLIFTVLFLATIPSNIIHYSAINLLWFCDIAIIITFFGLWLESSLLIFILALAVRACIVHCF